MSDLVLTGWTGVQFAQIAAHTVPLLARYAERHGAGFGCANLAGERTPSWMKVPALLQALRTHEQVAWIDADVVVSPDADCIFEAAGDCWQALVEHETDCGTVPNCGVWVVKPPMVPVLTDMWNSGDYRDHGWWEQAALLEQMGYEVMTGPHARLDAPTTLYANTTFLPPRWNHHPHDRRRVDAPTFVHVTQYADRIETVRRLCAGS